MKSYYELEPENNHFHSIFVDITHKCNMECANCYLPNRDIPDMDKNQLFNLLQRLPFKCQIRLVGAEPTMRKDLPEIISEVRKSNHYPILLTNGLKLSHSRYVKSLKKAGLHTVALSLNGGDDDEFYQKIDGMPCKEQKMRALENLAEMNFFINTSAIIVKGLNEAVPKQLYEKLKKLKVKRAVMRFRNVGQIGRHMLPKQDNYSYRELIKLIADEFQLDENSILKCNTMDGYQEKRTVFFPLEKNRDCSICIKITDWSPSNFNFPDPESTRRGRVTQNFKIAPFFEHIKRNEFGY